MAMSSVVRHTVKLSRGREGLRHGYCLYLVMTRKHIADTANQTFVHILVNRQILRKLRKKNPLHGHSGLVSGCVLKF